jgi:ubiquinone/menaquinone biosynthesis C-methylase UbiE
MQIAGSVGDSARVGSLGAIHAELLCEAVDVHAGERVLDIVAGSGAAALAAARRGGDVIAADLLAHLLAAARRIADASGLTLGTELADARSLPFDDDTFDVVVSTIGATALAEPRDVVDEMVRVCRPGGRIGLTTWAPSSLMGDVLAAIERRTPPVGAWRSTLEWSEEDRIRDLFGNRINALRVTRRQFVFRYRSPQHMLQHVRAYDGPIKVSFNALDPDGQQELAAELLGIHAAYNRATDGTVVAPGDYLEVVATVR